MELVQQQLFEGGHTLISTELIAHYDGPSGQVKYGYRLIDTNTREAIEMGTIPGVYPMGHQNVAQQAQSALHYLTIKHLSPF